MWTSSFPSSHVYSFYVFNFVSLVYMADFMPMLYCYYDFVMYLNIWNANPTNIVLFTQGYLCYVLGT